MSIERNQPTRWTAILAAVCGFLIVSIAVPRVVAYGFLAADGGRASTVLVDGGAFSAAELENARQRYSRALAVIGLDGKLARGLGRFDLWAFERGDKSALVQADKHLRQAASNMPNNTFVWSLLAYSSQMGDMPSKDVVDFLRLAQLTGPYEGPSTMLRIKVGFLCWDKLPDDVRTKVVADVSRLVSRKELLQSLSRVYLSLSYRARAIFLREAIEPLGKRVWFLKRVIEWNRLRGKVRKPGVWK